MESRQPAHGWEHTADAVIEADPLGRVLSWNAAAETLFGYSIAEAAGQSLRELLLADDGDTEPDLSVGNCVYEAMRRRRDGGLIHVNVSRRVADGEMQGRVVYCERDVTQLKVARDAQLVAARFGTLLESVPDATLIIMQ